MKKIGDHTFYDELRIAPEEHHVLHAVTLWNLKALPRAQDADHVHLLRISLHCDGVERIEPWLVRLVKESDCKVTGCGSHVQRVLTRSVGNVEKGTEERVLSLSKGADTWRDS